VLRDTPRSLASARLAGNWTPSRRRPSSIRLRICSKIWRCRFWRRLRSRHNGSCMSPSSSALFPQYCDNTGVSSTPAPETDHPMSETVLSLTQAQLAYGHHPLLDHADLALQAGERVGLIGRNGAGKSTLLRVMDGRVPLDDGEIRRLGGLRMATVEQEPSLPPDASVLEWLCGDLLGSEDWQRPARAGALIDSLGLQADTPISGLSGGMRKRVALAHALVAEPDLLLLDEPTNHLDFEGIAWLEERLLASRMTIVIITHDRRFLDVVATRIIELDRGRLLSFPGNFSAWQVRKAQWLESERLAEARFDKLLSQEEVWIRKGIEARRTRNEGRVRRLEALRRERAARRERQGQVRFSLADGQRSGKPVAELRGITHGYGGRTLTRAMDATNQRGQRTGNIGPITVGKTAPLRNPPGVTKPEDGSMVPANPDPRSGRHHPARRTDRDHRPQRRGQDHTAAHHPGRAAAGRGHSAPGHPAVHRLFRPDARHAGRQRDLGGHHQPGQRMGRN